MRAPNLARDPFLNRRPVRRAAVLLWVAAVALAGTDAWLYWRYFAGRGAQQDEIAALESQAAEDRRRLDETLAALDRFDLDWQRDQISFLNARIAERTFSWSALFDHVAEALPRSVRIERVTPRMSGGRSRRRQARSRGDAVLLEMTGAAESDEALLELVDAFYAHERFRSPNLSVESRDPKSKTIAFVMSVVYTPAPQEAAAETVAEPAPPPPAPTGEGEVQS